MVVELFGAEVKRVRGERELIMFNMLVLIELESLRWSSDWDGEGVGYPELEAVGLYSQERDDGEYSFYIDTETGKVLDFWKD